MKTSTKLVFAYDTKDHVCVCALFAAILCLTHGLPQELVGQAAYSRKKLWGNHGCVAEYHKIQCNAQCDF